MEKFLMGIGISVVGAFILFGVGLLAPLLGGISGWIVSLFFSSPFIFLGHMTGLEFTPFQWGATMAFVGAFFRAINYKEKS